MEYIFLFVLGSMVGSFLNVGIYRLPRNEKIGLSRSRCPHCKKTIRWYDNIPLVSYILLKAKCRDCGGKISYRYITVEFISAVSLCVLWWRFADPVLTAVYFVFVSLLIIATFVDFDFYIIPDEVNIAGIIVGLIACSFYPALMNTTVWWKGLLLSLAGLIAGGGSLYLVAVIGEIILKKEAMGMGDVKLLAMIGSIIGWQMALFTIFAASLLGTAAGLTLIFTGKTDMKGKIPFGPYLAAGSLISLFWGWTFMGWYMGMLR